MRIVDLTHEHEPLYFVCLEDWSSEMAEAGNHKQIWYEKMRHKGLRVKLALDDEGAVGGMIQYLPVEHSFAEGEDLDVILCIWVHGYKKGRGSFQRQGMGRALLEAAERDSRYRGAKGIAAWGIALPFWMKASWFKKMGYEKIDKDGMIVLLWKPFTDDAKPPTLIRAKKQPLQTEGKVTVTCYKSGWCPAQNIAFERAKRASREVGDDVAFVEIDTSERCTLVEWGYSDALFLDQREMRTGPPPSYEKVRSAISKKVKKLRKS